MRLEPVMRQCLLAPGELRVGATPVDAASTRTGAVFCGSGFKRKLRRIETTELAPQARQLTKSALAFGEVFAERCRELA